LLKGENHITTVQPSIMWFFAQIAGSQVEPHVQQPHELTSGDKQVVSNRLTSGNSDNSTANSAAPVVVPPVNDEENRADIGFEVNHRNVQNYSWIGGETTQASTRSVASSSATMSTHGMSTKSAASEEEQAGVEVVAAGSGYPLSNLVQLSKSTTVPSSDNESDLKTGGGIRQRWLLCIGASVMVAVIFLSIGLAVGFSRRSFKDTTANTVEVSEAAVVNATTPSTEEAKTNIPTNAPTASVSDNVNSSNKDDEDNVVATTTTRDDSAAATDTPTDYPTDYPTASISILSTMEDTMSATDYPSSSPSASQTVEVTVSGTTIRTELTCEESHNLMVASTCQSDDSESWSYTQLSYCFSQARDGDWYWIRGSDSDYDRWDYTEGASKGMLDFDSIPPGEYLVSLVRDSMQPYDVLITESVTVPDCSTTRV
jgi:hypothetical protein